MKRRVVITGAGLISSLGDSPAELPADLCAVQSGLRHIRLFATDGLACRQGGEIASFSARKYLGERGLGQLDRTSQLVTAAARLALDDSGWTRDLRSSVEVGLALGTM